MGRKFAVGEKQRKKLLLFYLLHASLRSEEKKEASQKKRLITIKRILARYECRWGLGRKETRGAQRSRGRNAESGSLSLF